MLRNSTMSQYGMIKGSRAMPLQNWSTSIEALVNVVCCRSEAIEIVGVNGLHSSLCVYFMYVKSRSLVSFRSIYWYIHSDIMLSTSLKNRGGGRSGGTSAAISEGRGGMTGRGGPFRCHQIQSVLSLRARVVISWMSNHSAMQVLWIIMTVKLRSLLFTFLVE